MEVSSPKTGAFSLKYGLILGGASVVLGLMLYMADLHYQQDWKTGIISMVLMIAAIVIALTQYKKANDGYLSLSEALKIGIGVTLIAAVIGIIYNMVLQNVLDPDMMQKAVDYQKAKMLADGVKPEQVEAAMEMGKKFQTPVMQIAFGLIGSLFLGFIFSLISGLILKKSKPE